MCALGRHGRSSPASSKLIASASDRSSLWRQNLQARKKGRRKKEGRKKEEGGKKGNLVKAASHVCPWRHVHLFFLLLVLQGFFWPPNP
jgi:hypothetical protein